MNWILWGYRQVFWCTRWCQKLFRDEYQPVKTTIHTDSLPWFWIGAVFDDNEPVTVTDIINRSLERGICVTPEYLRIITGIDGATWKYMDAKTLEEKDFPSDGFIIEDVHDNTVSNPEQT